MAACDLAPHLAPGLHVPDHHLRHFGEAGFVTVEDLVLGNDVEITVTASAVVEQEDAPVDLTEGEGDTGEADGYSNDE